MCDANVKPRLSITRIIAMACRMTDEKDKNMSREERLAAKLRENLRRRKSQAREMGDLQDAALPKRDTDS